MLTLAAGLADAGVLLIVGESDKASLTDLDAEASAEEVFVSTCWSSASWASVSSAP